MNRTCGRPAQTRYRWLWMGLGLGLLLAGCASTGPVERWTMTEDRAPVNAESAQGASRPVQVVFFRQASPGSRAGQPINLYINGHYQASLVDNTYTEQSLCPGAHRLAVHFNDVQRRYVTKTEGAAVTVGSDDAIQYFLISEDAQGQAGIRPATAVEARASRSLERLQTHTVPRVPLGSCTAC